MSTATHRNHPTIGELRTAGDWACAHGDLETLRHLVRQLAPYMRDQLHDELLELADHCQEDPELASLEWARLREHL